MELTDGKVHLVKPFVAAWLGDGMEHWKITGSLQVHPHVHFSLMRIQANNAYMYERF